MSVFRLRLGMLLLLGLLALSGNAANAHAYRQQGKTVQIADSPLTVTPPRDWNRLDARPGKYAETWTLDGEQLNDVTFYAGVDRGMPLLKERDKKRDPLPKFGEATLLIEIPELIERTYRAYKKIGRFTLTGSTPESFLGQQGISFAYEYIDRDELPRKGAARAVIIASKLYLVTYDAPRLHYFDKALADYRALTESARL